MSLAKMFITRGFAKLVPAIQKKTCSPLLNTARRRHVTPNVDVSTAKPILLEPPQVSAPSVVEKEVSLQLCKRFDDDPRFNDLKTNCNETVMNFIKRIKAGTRMERIFPSDYVFDQNARLQIVIDARGYLPENIKCMISDSEIRIDARKQSMYGSVEPDTTLSRNYKLTSKPMKPRFLLSADGILVLLVSYSQKMNV
uniref:Small heat shock protein 22.3 n=1 Tax=Lasioderma serricorne TaxID=295660 RepID=A0A5B8NJD2_9COLE|nr:small heat shock protein 22.3 [Lasioderma serricorne]